MDKNLKARLSRIRAGAPSAQGKILPSSGELSEASWPGWVEAGFKTLKRQVTRKLTFSIPNALTKMLAFLVPDIYRMGRIPSFEELLFFDLETTGLSGGAGTIAFLAAFGRFVKNGSDKQAEINITQYLLLDYPGESDFVERIVSEFMSLNEGSTLPLVVSYNGKSFDSSILNNRCLMNGINPPEYFHADLLHPARRLWKRMLPNCSQATIEVNVLGLDRSDDVSGAMAPDIWFSFLRNGDNNDLLSICEHNLKDISGLASLFVSFEKIACEPFPGQKKFNVDGEALALLWYKAAKNISPFFNDEQEQENCTKTAVELLKAASQNGSLKAALLLAIHAEWRLLDPLLALTYTEAALAFPGISATLKDELEKRKIRLENKKNK